MNIINILESKHIDNKFFFTAIFVILLLIYLPILGSIPFGDDYVYIFDNPHIRDASHPFVFFNYGTEFFKSWPLTFVFTWVQKQLFGEQYQLYRLFSLMIHFFNGLLVLKISKQFIKKYAYIIFLGFLFNPLVVENIYWVFQLKTLLSFFFFLLSFQYILKFNNSQKKKTYWTSFFFFTLSLLSKSTAIFFPITLLWILKFYKNKAFLLLPFFVISFILGLESIKGVAVSKGEVNKISTYQQDYFKKKENFYEKKTVSLNRNQPQPKTILKKQFEIEKYIISVKSYFDSLINIENFLIKTLIASNSLSFYLRSSLGLNYYQVVYPDLDMKKWGSYLSPILLCLTLIILFIFNKLNLSFLGLTFFLYLPISGFFYVPYMQFSYIADHWFYAALPFALLSIVWILEHIRFKRIKRILIVSIFLLCLIQTTLYNLRLRDTKQYFYNSTTSQTAENQQILYEYLIELEKREKNYNKALELSKKVYAATTSKKEMHIKNILNLAVITNDIKSYVKFSIEYSRLLFINGKAQEAINLLKDIPSRYQDKDYLVLLNLYQHALKQVNKDDVLRMKQLITK